MIGGGFFEPWPGGEALEAELRARLDKAPDYEAKLDGTRRWMKEWHFRIGVHFLRGLIHAREAGAQYTDLADAVIRGLWPVVVDNFALKHGTPPGAGAAIIGMGSLGARSLSATSDLDLIIIYDPEDQDMSDGRRPLGDPTLLCAADTGLPDRTVCTDGRRAALRGRHAPAPLGPARSGGDLDRKL